MEREFKKLMTEERVKKIKDIMYGKQPSYKEIELIDGWGGNVPENGFNLESFKNEEETQITLVPITEEEELEYLYVR